MNMTTQESSNDALGRLTTLQTQVLQAAALDCPMRHKTAFERIVQGLRIIGRRPHHWMLRPLANPTLEALRLFFCLNRFPDAAVMSVVREELDRAFDEDTLGSVARLAAQTQTPAV